MLGRVAGLVAKEPASRFTHAILTAQFVELQNDIHVMVIRFIHIWNSVNERRGQTRLGMHDRNPSVGFHPIAERDQVAHALVRAAFTIV